MCCDGEWRERRNPATDPGSGVCFDQKQDGMCSPTFEIAERVAVSDDPFVEAERLQLRSACHHGASEAVKKVRPVGIVEGQVSLLIPVIDITCPTAAMALRSRSS